MLVPVLAVLAGTGVLYYLFRGVLSALYLDYYYLKRMAKIRTEFMLEFEKGNYLIDIYEDRARLDPNRTFLIFQDRKYSYGEIERQANKTARAALEIGVRPGDTVPILIRNSPAFVWTFLGLMKAGIRTSFLNTNLRSVSLAHCIKSTESKYLIIGQDEELGSAVREILGDLRGMTVYQQGHIPHPASSAFSSLGDVMDTVSDDSFDRAVRLPVVQADEPCVYVFTSGTTGLPKAAIITWKKTTASAFMFSAISLTADDVLYDALPLYHGAGISCCIHGMIKGATVVLKEKFSARTFWDDCRKYDVTYAQYIGEICRYLLAQPQDDLDGVHKVKYFLGNGLRQDIWAEFQTRFKIPNIVEIYGATEAPIALFNLSNKTGACGRLSPNMAKLIPVGIVKFDVDSEAPARDRDGRCIPVKPGEVGLVVMELIPGKTSYAGYSSRQDETQKKLLHDVFKKGDVCFNSGDLMMVDKDYFLYFNDRLGDTFRWKGENVSTTEVGNVLSEVEFIQDANVYGVLIPGTEGRAGMAALTLNDDTPGGLSTQRLLTISEHVKKDLPSYARPRFLRLQEEFVITSTFKPEKTDLKREGFDVKKIEDPLYYLNPATECYEPLDEAVCCQIAEGKMRI